MHVVYQKGQLHLFYCHPCCTDSDILLYNVLIVSRFGQKCLLNALNVNATYQSTMNNLTEYLDAYSKVSEVWLSCRCGYG